MVTTILLVFAFVLACIATFFPGPIRDWVHIGWASLAFYFASRLIH